MRPRGQDWLDKVYRRGHSSNNRHSGKMALKAFDRVFGGLVEVLIDRVKNSSRQAQVEGRSKIRGYWGLRGWIQVIHYEN